MGALRKGRRVGSRRRLSLRELLSLLALNGGVGGPALEGECISKSSVSLSVVGISSDSRLKLYGGVGELATLEEETSAIECKDCPLAADGNAAEIGGFFTFGCCASGVALTDEDSRKSNVGTWLVGQ